MKNIKAEKTILRIVTTIFLVCTLFLGAFYQFLTPISAASAAEAPALKDATGTIYIGVAGFDEVINNPTRIDTDNGYYYAPSSYIYFGEVYNESTGENEPILCRVLNADADNAGGEGAAFVLTEKAINANEAFAFYNATVNEIIDWENIFTTSEIDINRFKAELYFYDEYSSEFDAPGELDYIRPITKEDVLENMSGAFGFESGYGYEWETNGIERNENNTVVAVAYDKAALLNDSKVFYLSVEELLQYVGNYNSAPGMATTHITTKAEVSWWLRTGLNDIYGNLVGGVNSDGKVTAVSVENGNVAGRYAFNIETADISYVQRIGSNIYRLSYIAPQYKNTETPFEAEIIDVENGVVTLKYSNSILSYGIADDESEYVSVMIKDKDTGAVKYYGTVASIPDGYSPDEISSKEYTASFTLPKGYNDGDTVSVFWERKQANEEGIGYTSNMVELGCIHEKSTDATCISLKTCSKCGESYGFVDTENHTSVGTELFYDDETDTHWNICADCNGKVNIEECEFGESCISLCKCTNIDITYEMHVFDENGICVYDKSHFENPIRIDRGFSSDFEIHNEGQFITFANYVNSLSENNRYSKYGEWWGYLNIIELKADLDFTDISGFVSIGTEESPFDALMFDGNDHTITGINYSSDDSYVGLFGVVKNTIDISNLKLTECSFSGKTGVSALVGKATGLEISCVIVGEVELSASEGVVGSFMAISNSESKINYSISYDVKDTSGANIPFSSDDNAVINKSYCLADEHDDKNGRMTLSQFESGEVGYLFGFAYNYTSEKSGGQQIGVDKYPYFGGMKVYTATTCDGEVKYFNDEALREEIEAHNYTAFAEENTVFVWEEKMGSDTYNCYVSAVCGKCGHIGMTATEVTLDYTYVPVRGDYTATITLGGITKTDSKTIIGIHIEEMIGMTYVEKDFDGIDIYPDEMMNNHRLDYDEYSAHFVNSETGEAILDRYWDSSYNVNDWVYYGTYVVEAGTYDLVVTGKGKYEGQSYTYKGALIINPITVTVTPSDVYKYYDGNTSFEAKYTADNESIDYDWLVVSLSNSESAQVGTYTLNVNMNYDEYAINCEAYKSSVTVILAKETVNGAILPQLHQSIENKNYPTELTYGDPLPTPARDNFTVIGGGELSFEWFEAKYYYDYNLEKETLLSLSRLEGAPVDAGDYILRVTAASTDSMLITSADFRVKINKKQLNIELTLPEGTEIKNDGDDDYYILSSMDDITVNVTGFAKDEALETANIRIHAEMLGDGYYGSLSDRLNYLVTYTVKSLNSVQDSANYEGSVSIRVSLDPLEEGELRDITMWVKECSFDLSSATMEFDIRNVVMKAGEVFYLGHTLTDVKLAIDGEEGRIWVDEFTVLDETGKDVTGLYSLKTYVQYWSHYSGGYNVVHIFDNPCDSDCNMEGCEFTRSASHKGGAATCISPAACSECGALYGEINENNHISANSIILPNADDLTTHAKIHSCCGAIIETSSHTEIAPATCTELAICSICGWSFGELDPTNHSSDESTYTLDSQNVNRHLKTHTCCGLTENEAHSGGEASCTEQAECEYCGAEYGELDPENHSEKPLCTLNKDDASLHDSSYPCCGAALAERHTGGTATCIATAVCELCGSEYGAKNPENHANDNITYIVREDNGSMHNIYHSCCNVYINKEYHTGGTASCVSPALCENCGTVYGKIDPTNHASTKYSYTISLSDENTHTKAYACCGYAISDEAHTGGVASCLHGTLCQYCRTDYGTKTEHIYDNDCDSDCNVCGEITRGLTFHVDEDGNYVCDSCEAELEKEPISGVAISAIATASTAVVGTGGFSLVWFALKKKSWASLLKFFIG